MPEEIVIALVILVAIVWAVAALFGAILKGLDRFAQDVSSGAVERRAAKVKRMKAKLATHLKVIQPHDLDLAERKLKSLETEFDNTRYRTVWAPIRPTWDQTSFKRQFFWPQNAFCSEMNIDEITTILSPDQVPWFENESAILDKDCSYPVGPPKANFLEFHEFPSPALELGEAFLEYDRESIREKDVDRYFQKERVSVQQYNQRRLTILSKYKDIKSSIAKWNIDQRAHWNKYIEESSRLLREEACSYKLHAQKYTEDCKNQKGCIGAALKGFQDGKREAVIARINFILGTLKMPFSVPRQWEIDYDEDQHILIVETGLPDVVHRPPVKIVDQKSGPVAKPLNQSERKEFIPKIHPAILLRIGFELFRNDTSGSIKLLVLNGHVVFNDPTTGLETKAYTASLMVERQQLISLNLMHLDPVAAFQGLKGKSAGRLIEIIPIEPVLNLKKTDSRFVDAREILNILDGSTNLAAMDWQDFEHLIRELFEKEFSGRGGEVKITQASRDRGVDAIVFDPDPIHGGKYIIQAKRYTGTVDVSAVRDLCAVVRKEGASRGILVTTSTYGADAYAFANNEPVTLLNGAELLGLLKKHGYTFRINLQEARQLKQSLA